MRIRSTRNTALSRSSARSAMPDRIHTPRNSHLPRLQIIGLLLVIALLSFELFNFDTTRFALESVFGDMRFLRISWASILAIAFCAIDFAGLTKLFTPSRSDSEPREVWYLMGAWFLGATMNAVMTWWAVSMALMNSQIGVDLLAEHDLLRYAPVFVAAFVWLTRILFIGSLSAAGERLRNGSRESKRSSSNPRNDKRALPRRAPVFSGSVGNNTPLLAPQPVDIAAASVKSQNQKSIRRPSISVNRVSDAQSVQTIQARRRS